MTGKRRAYLVTFPRPIVVIADDPRDLREWVSELAHDGFDSRQMTVEELAAQGDAFPAGSWDPDRELTCAEIAAEMASAVRS